MKHLLFILCFIFSVNYVYANGKVGNGSLGILCRYEEEQRSLVYSFDLLEHKNGSLLTNSVQGLNIDAMLAAEEVISTSRGILDSYRLELLETLEKYSRNVKYITNVANDDLDDSGTNFEDVSKNEIEFVMNDFSGLDCRVVHPAYFTWDSEKEVMEYYILLPYFNMMNPTHQVATIIHEIVYIHQFEKFLKNGTFFVIPYVLMPHEEWEERARLVRRMVRKIMTN